MSVARVGIQLRVPGAPSPALVPAVRSFPPLETLLPRVRPLKGTFIASATVSRKAVAIGRLERSFFPRGLGVYGPPIWEGLLRPVCGSRSSLWVQKPRHPAPPHRADPKSEEQESEFGRSLWSELETPWVGGPDKASSAGTGMRCGVEWRGLAGALGRRHPLVATLEFHFYCQ